MRDGDVYRWRWRDDARDADCGPYRSYHCCSQIAVVERGVLRDTFWHSSSDNKVLKPEDVTLDFQGNLKDFREVAPGYDQYFKRSDVIDMGHSNNYGGPVYVRRGAQRDAETMLDLIQDKRERAESEARMAQRCLEEMDRAKVLVKAGRLDDVWL